MEIILGKGLGSLSFGMVESQVTDLIGKPDFSYIDEHHINEHYKVWNKLKLRCTFYEEENFRLAFIRSKSENLHFLSQPIIGKDINWVKTDVFKSLTHWEVDDFQYWKTYFNEKNWVSLISEYGQCVELEMGVPFKNDDTYNWPSI